MDSAGTAQSELIDEERLCISCGYNLRTLHWSGRCPECGRDVLDSMGRNLFAADLDWLRCVRRGMILLSLHIAAGVAAALAHSYGPSLMLLYVLVPAGPKTGTLVDVAKLGPFGTVAALLGLLLYGAGTWLFTRTGVFESVASSQTNTGMRWTSMVWVGMGLLAVGCAYLPRELGDGALLIMGAMIAEVLLIILTYARLANLAEMARASRLAVRTRWMILAHLLVMMMVMTCFLVDARIAAVILALLDLAGLIVWVIYFRLLSTAIRGRQPPPAPSHA